MENFILEDVFYYNTLKESKDIKKSLSKATDKGKEVTINAINLIKKLYYVKDEDMVEDKILPKVSRLITQSALITGVALLNPICGLIAFYANKFAKKDADVKQRSRLIAMYKDKLEYVSGLLDKEDDEKEKYKLIKLKSELRRAISRLEIA